MCRNNLSVGWDGRVYDCDFNQMLELPGARPGGAPCTSGTSTPAALAARRIVTRRHCFGCTAGAGSSCGGALERNLPALDAGVGRSVIPRDADALPAPAALAAPRAERTRSAFVLKLFGVECVSL